MEILDWQAEALGWKAEWKCVSATTGALCVITCGTTTMLRWLADRQALLMREHWHSLTLHMDKELGMLSLTGYNVLEMKAGLLIASLIPIECVCTIKMLVSSADHVSINY